MFGTNQTRHQTKRKIDLELDVVVVSKITLPWNTEAGYGAVAFDATIRLNKAMLSNIGRLWPKKNGLIC
jgi:predicted phosphoribosyltransferase